VTKKTEFHIDYPPGLPISVRAGEIVAAIAANQVVILAGETGSGKTTQVPKMCLAAGRGRQGRIACTQPRRVAALSLSRRVAEEMGVEWGGPVGCKVRFADQTTRATVIKFLTDGMLLAEVQGDPMLREYDTIVVDEAHERSLNIDFLIGHLRQLRLRRPELRIVITSATIDTEAFSAAFDGAPVIVVEGRTFPVEVVYAPLDGLGSDAAEGDEPEARAEALHYIDGAVAQVERIAARGAAGDVLVFMPSERDIRETCELLGGRLKACEVIPLFGRLSNADQQRIFSRGQRRRVVVATNIAETSLTIPGIRHVVDTGLARVSRYSPQSRTRRLPIEAVARSSADQRKGRCGRLADGVCVRLYSEEDYLARPRFAQPEIQRANLADVILRLKAGGLGDVESFPFLSPPAPKAIRAGYALLEELGALGETAPGSEGGGRPLTAIGSEIARLPVDPTVGRMILQARVEKAVREVLVVASGLSIQDPRERPLDQRAQADAAHRRFVHPDSDFLTLLNIWEAFHAEVESMSQGRLRKFCRSHFLSYLRMREWRDVHAQLLDVLRERDDFKPTSVFDGLDRAGAGSRDAAGRAGVARKLGFNTAGYRAIHRSILAGVLGSIAVRDEETGGYRATHDRRVALFPGSALHSRKEAAGARSPGRAGSARDAARGPRWIMAAEVMETSRLYARTCARLDPAWALDLAAHLLRVSHGEPFWDAEAGRVMVKRRSRLYGLEIDLRSVGYGAIDPARAGEIFIREGLVNDTITRPFEFLDHNRKVRERIETLLTRTRDPGYQNLDEAVYRFYSARIGTVSAVAELAELVRDRRAADPRFLMMEPGDLRDPSAPEHSAAEFPEALPLENRALPLQYAYQPGKDGDGVTLDVGVREALALTQAAVDWAVPGHLAARVEHHLRTLPREMRRAFVPLNESARRLAEAIVRRDRLTGRRETVAEALASEIGETRGLRIEPSALEAKPPPDHLRVRLRVLDDAGRELCSGREMAAIHAFLDGRERAAAGAAGRDLRALFENELRRDLGWLHGELRILRDLGTLASTLQPPLEMAEDAFRSIRTWACGRSVEPFSDEAFGKAVAEAKAGLRGLAPRLLAQVREILLLRQELLVAPHPYPGLAPDLAVLVPAGFLAETPYPQLAHLPRYLRAMKVRGERWRRDPAKDAERARMLAPYAAAAAGKGGSFRWMVEEFRVSLFAQELGTAEPVSAVKLERLLKGKDGPDGAGPVAPESVPAQIRPSAQTGALKSLGALDRVFPRRA